jgi:type II secretory pathway pseudopilin PulG
METMRRSESQPGFTLPAVLVVVAALLILAVGILLVTGVERDTARSFVDRQRAELAARAGLEEFRGILAKETANDDYIVIQSTLAAPATSNAPHLFIARGKPDTAPFEFRYIPLFSALKAPEPSELKAPEINDQITGAADEYINFSTLPYQDMVRAAWLPVLDEKGRIVARYAYWVEDLQSRVDPSIAGNDKDKTKNPNSPHARVKWPFPAPGLNDLPDAANEPALNQIATFALDPAATDADQKSLGKTLFNNRAMLVSPESPLAAAAIQPPLERLPTRDLVDPKADAVEKGLVAGLRSYQEQPLVPFAAGIDPGVAGDPKLNLNKLLATGGEAAVDEMAAFINEALPDFDDRKGGFPDDYVKTLAANTIDYADDETTDNKKNPTVKDGEYRGIDGYPLVSEYLFKCLWEKKRIVGGRTFMDLSCAVYVEFWNMANVPVDGDAEITYETKYGFQIPPNPSLFQLGDLTSAVHNLTDGDGYKWFPKFNVKLQPNEYRVYKCGTVTYSLDVGPETPSVGNSHTLTGELSASPRSGYRMRWNGKLVDQSRGGVRRQDMVLKFRSAPVPGNQEVNIHDQRQQVRASIPGHTGSSGAVPIPNMGDARMAFYIVAPQTSFAYPEGYSPNRRNIRMNIYTPDNKRAIGRVLPSEWPDGGHDSPFGTDTIYGLLGMLESDFVGNYLIEPDNAIFSTQLPDLTLGEKEASTRLSNSGRFYSVTELGRVYDPVMWQTLTGPNPFTGPSIEPGQSWGNVSSSTSSANHGGGNTFRIGRPEHPQFDVPGLRASHLLDLFHTGISRSADADAALREGPLVKINGHVNLNTASKPALRQLIAGSLGQDPEMRRFKDNSHAAGASKFPQMEKLSASEVPDVTAVADRMADAIMRSRPFASTGELANTRESNGTRVFGNPELFPGFTGTGYPKLQWTDSAAEETFARAHDASTVRSRNFRIWVVGQSLAPSASVSASPKVLAEIRKNFTVFADPGERKTDNTPDPVKFRLKILHESDF